MDAWKNHTPSTKIDLAPPVDRPTFKPIWAEPDKRGLIRNWPLEVIRKDSITLFLEVAWFKWVNER
jgi:hypothetical protein